MFPFVDAIMIPNGRVRIATSEPAAGDWCLSTVSKHGFESYKHIYRQVSNIRRILVDNKIVDHSDVVGASPVGAAPTTSSFST